MSSLKFWHTLQFKLIILLTVLFLIISTVLVFFNFKLYRLELIKTLTHSAISLNESIESSLEMAMISGKRDQIQQAIERIGSDEQIVSLFISDKSGEIRAASDTLFIGRILAISDPSCQICHKGSVSGQVQSVIYKNQQGIRILRTISPIYNQAGCYSCHDPEEKINGVLYLDYSLKSHDNQFAYYKSRVALLGGFTILTLACLTFIFLKKFVIQRVKKLVSRLQSIGEGELKESLKSSGHDEFSLLADSINKMSFKIDESINKISEQRDYLQSVIDNVHNGLIVVDKNYNIALVNKVFLQIIEKNADEVLGLPCCNAFGKNICGRMTQREKCPAASVLKSGKFEQAFHTYQNEQGQRKFEISASPLFDNNGDTVQAIEIIRDITEKERLENELLQSEKMAVMGRLAAGVAHEINNPLATISNCTEGLLNRVHESDEKVIRKASWLTEYLNRIEKCVYRCKSIIDRLLVFSRSTKMIKKTIDLNRVVLDTIPLLSHRAKQEQIKIVTSLSPSLAKIEGEPIRISQMILNLVINSFDAISDGGEIIITTYDKNSNVCVNISDNGKGIAKQDISHIFEPFFTTKEVGNGTGLGLAICQRIVDEHNGKISAESIKGKGCKFEIMFPRVY